MLVVKRGGGGRFFDDGVFLFLLFSLVGLRLLGVLVCGWWDGLG